MAFSDDPRPQRYYEVYEDVKNEMVGRFGHRADTYGLSHSAAMALEHLPYGMAKLRTALNALPQDTGGVSILETIASLIKETP
ncbi:hypothetical protein CMI37_19570 [Candidatus Pacearchaeota archaeon]|nr:hypothetical protein [Candidatus Pacearchaeota archaeon]